MARMAHSFSPEVSHQKVSTDYQKVNLKACAHPKVVVECHTPW